MKGNLEIFELSNKGKLTNKEVKDLNELNELIEHTFHEQQKIQTPPPPEIVPPAPVPVADACTTWTTALDKSSVNDTTIVSACLAKLSQLATTAYRAIEPQVYPDSITCDDDAQCKAPSPPAPREAPTATELEQLRTVITEFLDEEASVSTNISVANAKVTDKQVGTGLTYATNLQKILDAIAADLLGYYTRIGDLEGSHIIYQGCDELGVPSRANERCAVASSRVGTEDAYQRQVTRTMTYALNSLNLVANSQESIADTSKRKALVAIVINFAGSEGSWYDVFDTLRWDGSVGLLFSSLPIRSFPVVPVFEDGVLTDKKIGQSMARPTVVPFVAINYRLTNDIPWFRWKSNAYLTGGAGINPSSLAADFAAGLSFSWRAFMLGALVHFAHDTRLTPGEGLVVGGSLGPMFNGAVPTQSYWTYAFGVGLSVRVSSLTGR